MSSPAEELRPDHLARHRFERKRPVDARADAIDRAIVILRRQSSVLSAALLLFLLCDGRPHAQTQGFAVDVTWEGSKSCFDPQSPPFTLSGVPPGTKQLRFTMIDLDAPTFSHGGGTVPYQGQQSVPRGAFSYRGPCPPQGQHRYRWTVEARDAADHVLAIAAVTTNFPPR
jgi:hypothetical protein